MDTNLGFFFFFFFEERTELDAPTAITSADSVFSKGLTCRSGFCPVSFQ